MNWLTHDVETSLEVEALKDLFKPTGVSFLFSKEGNSLYRIYLSGDKETIRYNIQGFDKDLLEIPKDYYPDRSKDLNSLLDQMKYSADSIEKKKYCVGFLFKEMKRLIDRDQIITFYKKPYEKRFIRKLGNLRFENNEIDKPYMTYSGLKTGITKWNSIGLGELTKLSV
jgi:hypothetical protein